MLFARCGIIFVLNDATGMTSKYSSIVPMTYMKKNK